MVMPEDTETPIERAEFHYLLTLNVVLFTAFSVDFHLYAKT